MDTSYGTIFVGSIPASATRQELFEYFSQFGSIIRVEVSSKKQRRRSTQRNPGYCQIVVGDWDTAAKILRHENHHFQGRKISCQPFRKSGSLKRSNLLNNRRRIIIKNLPVSYTEFKLIEYFKSHGEIDIGFILGAKGLRDNEDRVQEETLSAQV